MRRVLLIVSGGVAAYKIPETVRRLRDAGCAARVILTKAGAQFVTPMTLQAVSGDQVHTDMFSLTDESRMGHIELSRSADIVLAAPASADLTAKMAAGLADDLASTALLATDKPVVIAPAMNVRMWEHPATQANIAALKARGVALIGPAEGDMACGEYGMGRMAEPDEIVAGVLTALESAGAGGAEALAGRLAGRRALVTSGPTHEPIDPARYIANRSSGKQGHAVAAALAAAGAHTTLVSGPAQLPDPAGVETVHVATAREMLAACEAALPADVCVCAAAVADWRVENAAETKIKKDAGAPPALRLAENPDILRTLARRNSARPGLVIGFAAETGDVVKNAAAKRAAKGCDWIAANDVSEGSGVFGGDDNTLHLITAEGVEDWPRMSKHAAAERLAARIAGFFEGRGVSGVEVCVHVMAHGEGLELPDYATVGSAGVDLRAAVPEGAPVTLKHGKREIIPTGLRLVLPKDYEAQIRPRSGLAVKNGVTVLNTPGTIDSDYRGEVKIALINLGKETFTVERGMRIAQMVIQPVTRVTFSQISELDLDETERGAGGFGSTGTGR